MIFYYITSFSTKEYLINWIIFKDTQKEAEVAESKWKKVSFEEIKQAFDKEQKAKEEQAKLKKK